MTQPNILDEVHMTEKANSGSETMWYIVGKWGFKQLVKNLLWPSANVSRVDNVLQFDRLIFPLYSQQK